MDATISSQWLKLKTGRKAYLADPFGVLCEEQLESV